jgi:hypothetical protein
MPAERFRGGDLCIDCGDIELERVVASETIARIRNGDLGGNLREKEGKKREEESLCEHY